MNRCPELASENLSYQLSVPSLPTTPKVSALCASPFGGAAQQDQHLRADEYPQGAGRICNAPSSRTAALGIGPYIFYRRFSDFHTPQVQSKALVDGGAGEPFERFPCRLFPFLIGTERRPSTAVGFREGRRRLRIWSFRRPGGSGMEQASSDAAAVLFFLRKEKEKNGGAKMRIRNARQTIPQSA